MALVNEMALAAEITRNRAAKAQELKSKGSKIIGYFCALTPVELLTAAGVVPVRVGGSMDEPLVEVHGYLESIACSFTRSCLELALKGRYSYLDGIVFPHACDNIVKLYDIWSYNIPHEFSHFLNVPHTLSAPSMEFLRAELGMFKKALERYTGKAISDDSIRDAVRLHNRQRALVRRLYDLRRKNPAAVRASDATRMLLACMTLPVREANALLEPAITALEHGANGETAKGPRLMLCGTGNEDTLFVEMIEECGGHIVVDDLCFGSRAYFFEVEETPDPLEGLARSYLNEIKCPRTFRESPGTHLGDLENRFGHIDRLAREFGARGIVYFTLRYCDTHAFDLPDLREYLQIKGIPTLVIEEEYPVIGMARLKTRIEAFLEMIS